MRRHLLAFVAIWSFCCHRAPAADNELTADEAQAGWQLLFDGKSLDGWKTSSDQPSQRPVEHGTLNPHRCGGYMLIHEQAWGDFVLSLDFKISRGCNSGIFVRTWPLAPRPGRDVGYNGFEVAIDDTQTAGYHDTGALYDLVPCAKNAMRPVGEWNHIEITCDRARIAVVLNGQAVSEMNLDEWTAPNRRPDGSEHKFDEAFKTHPRSGYIGLQDHGSDCWFKNVKLRPLGTAGARKGKVDFEPTDQEAQVPPRFHMEPHSFAFEQKFQPTSSTSFRLSNVTFPSPVVTPDANNNTVHCEYFCPIGGSRQPGVVVLHILGGDFELARFFCRGLASNGVSALFLKMPYYGERRQPGSSARMVSIDPKDTVAGMTQAVLDIRQATAWLGQQPDVDADQLGVMGISLGGITGALAVTAEPRLGQACLILAGGDIGQVAWESKELSGLRQRWLAEGGTRETLLATMREVDPVAYGANVRGKRILMLNAAHDEVIPRSCTDSLWHAFGEPEIHWWEAGHYTAARFIMEGVGRSTRFFQNGHITAK